jgi:DNA polymerase III epsilon subunit-like protein
LGGEGDLYISIDVEADGPIPGDYSMSSIGAVVCEPALDRTFYRELKPISELFVHEAAAVSGLDRAKLAADGADPHQAMREFEWWLQEQTGGRRRPVAVMFNATFDWQFVNWYFLHFLGKNPFGISALDIKALYMGALGVPRWRDTSKRTMDKAFLSNKRHSHNALEDAVEQAEVFLKVYERALANRNNDPTHKSG